TNKTVTIVGLQLAGADAGKYALPDPATNASISVATLSVTATGVNKVYDGATNASVTLSDNRVSGDSLSTSYTNANFSDKNVANGKTVTVTGIAASGTDAPNYTPNTNTTTTANITPAMLTGTADNKSRLYGASNPVFTATYTGFVSNENSSLVTGTL